MGIPQGWLSIDLGEMNTSIRELQALRAGLEKFPKESRAAMVRVLNRAGNAVIAESVKIVFSRYMMKKNYIRRAFSMSKANYSRMYTHIWATGPRATHLTNWSGTRQTKAGVRVRILRGKGEKLIRSAFIASGVHSGKKIAFQRTAEDGSRYPISALYTTSGLDTLNNPVEYNKIFIVGRSRLVKTATQELNYRLGKLAEKGLL